MTNILYVLDDSPWFEWIQLDSTDSTNQFLKNYRPVSPKDMTLVTADFQTSGRGQTGNSWESESGANLLFSIKILPKEIEADRQFILSQAIALSIRDTLTTRAEGFSIKWPNDIYWHDKKVCGLLIENTLVGKHIESCIIGAGLNINQQTFRSQAPNPVSLRQITGQKFETVFILAEIIKRFKDYLRDIQTGKADEIARHYKDALYRGHGFYPYEDEKGDFEAEIRDVEPAGHLVLMRRDGTIRRYAFKEVKFLIPSDRQTPLAL
ncbi:MAG: biotin--[acetyl-CoA-carboxylase] ligase [Paraprevotella sp.]|nr:biotin--[acetyl-CoA-carboxylase] ligase [Paraprevotella sp.]